MMRLFKSFTLVCCVLALAACGGGGGGGGGPVPDPAPQPLPVSAYLDMSKGGEVPSDFSVDNPGAAAAVAEGVDLGGGFTLEQGSLRILKDGEPFVTFETGTGGDVNYYGDGDAIMAAQKENDQATLDIIKSLESEEIFGELTPGDYVDENVNDNNNDPPEYFTGSVWWPSQTIYLNAGAVNLQYSSFGAWAYDLVYRGEFNGEPMLGGADFHSMEYRPFYGGAEDRQAVPAASGGFTGYATAMVIDWSEDPATEPDVFVPISGTANLDITNLNDVELTLAFPEFYDITYSGFAINPVSGAIEVSRGYTPTLTNNGNATGVDFSGHVWPVAGNLMTQDTFLNGQFYGPEGNASEAAGAFGLYTADDHGVVGSFGVVAAP